MLGARRLLLAGSALGVVTVAAIASSATAHPQAYKPVIGKAVTVPARPLAGKPFKISFKVVRSDTKTRLLKGTMICDPSIAGKVIRHAESFKGGIARLAFVVPATAEGKLLKVKVTIKASSGTSAMSIQTFAVQREATVTPSLAISDASVAEGNAGTTPLSFTVTLSGAGAKTVSVSYVTSEGTATAPSDYMTASGTLTFKPEETSKQLSVSVVGDTAIEPNETFTVGLSNPVNATISRGTATGTITNDDTSVPITAGSYKGLLDGNFLFFDVVDRYVTHFRSNYVREDCNSGGWYVYGTVDWGDSRFMIGPDGTFKAAWTGPGTVSGEPATFHDEVAGRFDGTNVSGTVLGAVEWDHQGTHLTCTSGQKPWTASLQP